MGLPRIISADDHVVEPPDVWTSRLPARSRAHGPRVERLKIRLATDLDGLGSALSAHARASWIVDPEGTWADVWRYEDLFKPLMRANAIVGEVDEGRKFSADFEPTTFEEIRRATWDQTARLRDMDLNNVDVSVCFPGTIPRFCGQTFAEATDKKLALLCVRAYNDWMVDEWCGGDGHGRLIPLAIVPMWDPELAREEVLRCAGKGSFAVCFSENPYALGLPSISDRTHHWDPLFAACAETGTMVCMHFGSSSQLPAIPPDAPPMAGSALSFQNGQGSMLEFILSGVFVRFPRLKIMYAEHQVGWMPFVLERADKLWEQRGDTKWGSSLPTEPSSYVRDHVYSSIFDDETGLKNREAIGMDQILFETDYPHGDGTFPISQEVLGTLAKRAELTDEETYKFARGNAIRAFGLDRFGIDQ